MVDRAYVERWVALCDDPDRLRELERRVSTELRAFVRGHKTDLAPTWSGGLRLLARSMSVTLASLLLAVLAVEHGRIGVGIALVYLTAFGLYGLFSLMHDALHGSLLPDRRANRWLGHALATVFLVDYPAFRRSHLDHHRASQSQSDPKRLGMPPMRFDDPHGYLFGSLAGYRPLLRGWTIVGAAILRAPAIVRLPFYVVSMAVFVPIFILTVGAEFSFAHRNWREPGRWLALAASIGFYGLVALIHPTAALLLLLAAIASYAYTFVVFLTHLGPHQLYFDQPLRSVQVAGLNVSDVHGGWLLAWFGHGISEHHCAHHLVPHVPVYALGSVTRFIDERFADIKAPAWSLGPKTALEVTDTAVAFAVYGEGHGWARHETKACGVMAQRLGRSRSGPTPLSPAAPSIDAPA